MLIASNSLLTYKPFHPTNKFNLTAAVIFFSCSSLAQCHVLAIRFVSTRPDNRSGFDFLSRLIDQVHTMHANQPEERTSVYATHTKLETDIDHCRDQINQSINKQAGRQNKQAKHASKTSLVDKRSKSHRDLTPAHIYTHSDSRVRASPGIGSRSDSRHRGLPLPRRCRCR